MDSDNRHARRSQQSTAYPQFDPSQRLPPPGNNISQLQNPQLQVSHMSDARLSKLIKTKSAQQNQRQESLPALSTSDPLDQDSGGNQRYSILQTPIEMQSPVFPPAQRRPTEPTIPQSPTSPAADPAYHTFSPDTVTAPDRVTSPYMMPPPMEQHPAMAAPYADDASAAPRRQSYHVPSNGSEKGGKADHMPARTDTKSEKVKAPIHDPSGSDQYQAQYQAPQTPGDLQTRPNFPSRTSRVPTYNPDSALGPDQIMPGDHRPGQIRHPTFVPDTPEWKNSLCGCGDFTTCCTGFWCPCVLYGKTQYRLNRKTAGKDATDLLGYSAFNGSCGLFAVACGFQGFLALLQHSRIRSVYNLNGSVPGDIIPALCCCCCMLMQTENEMRCREENVRGAALPATGLGAGAYVPPPKMTYAPPAS
ncbi:MAG: hypothetical protein M4579_005764 [Chaenotheca gracillima]|nr:MAG: hypothetical protein M4579_005764 [Chaenotheca gracillima]